MIRVDLSNPSVFSIGALIERDKGAGWSRFTSTLLGDMCDLREQRQTRHTERSEQQRFRKALQLYLVEWKERLVAILPTCFCN